MTALAPSLRRAEWAAPVLGACLAAAILYTAPGDPAPLATGAVVLGALVIWIIWQDMATLTISDAALATVAAVAFAFRWSTAAADGQTASQALVAIIVDVALCGGMLLLFREAFYRFKGFDGLGLGDVKLAAAGALLVGGVGFSWALFAASLAALASVAAARLLRPTMAPAERLAFGAVLAPAIWGVWVIEQALPRLFGG